jgi:branched-chain amino acid transport system permease protein
MHVTDVIQAAINGLLTGAVYALIGMGMALIFGVMRIVNFAHGAFLMLGMYVTLKLFQYTQINPYYTFLLPGAVLFVLGYSVYKGLLQRVSHQSEFMQILLTWGIGLILIGGVQVTFTAGQQQLNITLLNEHIRFGPFTVNTPGLLSCGIATVLIVLLYMFVMCTPLGRAVRAIAQNRDAAPLMGINVNRVQAVSFGIGTTMAGIAGALLLPPFYLYPTVGEEFMLKSFVIVVLGGMGSITGAAIAGLLLGVCESQISLLWSNQWALAVDFLIFLLVVSLRPSGIFGSHRT